MRRIPGRLEGVERALQDDAPCAEVLRQLASARGALTGLTTQVLQDHLQAHVADAPSEAERRAAGQKLMSVLRMYM